jgi:hypothetical protein
VTISRLGEVLDEPELNRALGIKQNSRRLMTSPASLTLCCEWPGLMMPVTEYDHVVEAVPLHGR